MDSNLRKITESRIETERQTSLLSNDDSIGAKLLREAYVFGVGTTTGVGCAVADKVSNPLGTLGEGIGAYAVGYGLGLMQRKVPGLKLLGAALTYSMIKDIGLRAESLGGIWSDTWSSPQNLDSNLKGVQNTLGHFIVDTAFTTAVGGLGARRGAATARQNDLYRMLKERNFDNESIGTLRVCRSDGGVSYGTVFAIDEKRLVTSSHVVGELPNYGMSAYSARSSNDRLVKLVVRDAASDLAILESQVPHGIKPLKLAQTTPLVGTDVVAMGYGNGSGFKTFLPREGKFRGVLPEFEIIRARRVEMTTTEKIAEIAEYALKQLVGNRGKPADLSKVWTWSTSPLRDGMSGGPLINPATLEVVGVTSFSVGRTISGFSSIKDLRVLMQAASNAGH